MNTPRNPGGSDLFVLFDKRYDVDRMLKRAATGPTITPKVEEVDLTTNHVAQQSDPEGAKSYNGSVVFYQYEGKYILLAGYDKTRRALEEVAEGDVVTHLKGRLISKQTLKRCLTDDTPTKSARVIDEQIREAANPTPRYNDDQQRRPSRFNNS